MRDARDDRNDAATDRPPPDRVGGGRFLLLFAGVAGLGLGLGGLCGLGLYFLLG